MAARGGKKVVIVKKKIVGGGGHHGGSWKVAYADFVTAMMAFFMVMWILGMDDKTKQAIEGYFANPVGYKKGYGAGSSPLATGSSVTSIQRTPLRMIVRSTEQRTFEQLRQTILDKLAASDSLKRLNALVDVQVTQEGLRIELVESGRGDVYFPLGSARMYAATVLTLQLVGGSALSRRSSSKARRREVRAGAAIRTARCPPPVRPPPGACSKRRASAPTASAKCVGMPTPNPGCSMIRWPRPTVAFPFSFRSPTCRKARPMRPNSPPASATRS